MDKKGDSLTIMTKDGQFIEIKNYKNTAEIGQEINYNSNKVLQFNKEAFRKALAIAAVFIMILTGGYGVYGYYAPFGYVDVDINPSVELSYNLYDRVISIKGLNEDGNNIITKIDDYINKPVKEIVVKVIETAIEKEYIKNEEENTILLTITESGSKIDDEDIFQTIDNQMKEQNIKTEVLLIKSDEELYEIAKENNLSPGKQMIINKAVDSNDNISDEDIKDKSVKEIIEIINENKDSNKELEKQEKYGIKYQNRIEKEAEKLDKTKKSEKLKKQSIDNYRDKDSDNINNTNSNKKDNRDNSKYNKDNKKNDKNDTNKDNTKNSKDNNSSKDSKKNRDDDKNNDKQNNKDKDKDNDNRRNKNDSNRNSKGK